MIARPRILFLASLFAAGAALAVEPAVEVSDAWARATPPGAANGAVFFTLHNRGADADRLRKVSSPASKAVELHTHVMDGGVARMRQVAEIAVPAGGSAALKPGGLHVMLLGLQQPLRDGEAIELVLHFDKAGERKLRVPVFRAQPGHSANAGQHGPAGH